MLSAPLIAVAGLEKTYATRARTEVRALAGISLDIAVGEFVTIVGQSGCGKTTLLKVLAGLRVGTVPVADLYTPDLVDRINAFDAAAIVRQAKKYKL